MQVRVPTKACSSFIFSFFYNVATTLQQPCHNLAATSPQPCNRVVTVSIPWFLQPCGNLAARLWWTTLLQGCSKLVTLVWELYTAHSIGSRLVSFPAQWSRTQSGAKNLMNNSCDRPALVLLH